MPTIVLRFPGGRYHATPEGHHVNEGLVEWPPSPWRLVRALLACGYATQHWKEVPREARRLIESLSGVLPEYRLPRAALGHSRHYMPTTKLKDGRENTTLVLDAFADVGDGAVWVRWPVPLDPSARETFETLVAHLGYLGRSESWVIGEVVADDAELPSSGVARPHSAASAPGKFFEQIVLGAPEVPAAYTAWRAAQIQVALDELDLATGKRLTQAQQKRVDAIDASYPSDLVDCLERDTVWWKGEKWSRAPGSRSVLYWREANALEVGPPPRPRARRERRVEMMLLGLTTPSGSKSALPTVARTLPQAELIHRALVKHLGVGGEHCPELVGKDEKGAPLVGHRHAHLLPLDLDNDGHIDHVVVHAAMGLGARAQQAVRRLRATYMKGGVGELQVAVAGIGTLDDLRSVDARHAGAVAGLLGPAKGGSLWISRTPFVPPRHIKPRGNSSVVGQIEAELASRGLPRAKVELLELNAERLALRHFVRRRSRGPQPAVDVGLGVRLVFDEPVRGPIALGYGSHFGLGLFAAIE